MVSERRYSAVHPRVCGEQLTIISLTKSLNGSSPRVRGTESPSRRSRRCYRFIPACAGNSTVITRVAWPVAVHPRVCGEQVRRRDCDCLLSGSSPRVRGTVSSANALMIVNRFIPACAGNSLQGASCHRCGSVHPRVCGEQSCRASERAASDGSSPRVRGTDTERTDITERYRFIPACAGNRPPLYARITHSPVHPRVCGEQLLRSGQLHVSSGSSPRVRGTAIDVVERPSSSRFIPACAGNRYEWESHYTTPPVHPRVCGEQSAAGTAANGWKSVHPRVCGEQCLDMSEAETQAGSSPRVRGTVHSLPWALNHRRFIPACAGNRLTDNQLSSMLPVHPRVCGEQRGGQENIQDTLGSSPRVRGTEWVGNESDCCSRFIPACAGNRQAGSATHGRQPVHPRVCGEQNCESVPPLPPTGSSPRVRGTAMKGFWHCNLRRFIPACAGNRGTTRIITIGSSVHPRVCGEQVREVLFAPRRRRFIPACAGNS